MFDAGDYVVGAVAGLIVGLSKTALPGAGLLATPLLATVFSGRMIAGGTLPILLAADLFAVRWYRHSTRWDLLRPLAIWVALGFAAGATFYVVVGKADRTIEVVIGVCILVVVVMQAYRLLRASPPAEPSAGAAALYGSAGGFTTFVSNNAGPIMNAYLLRLGLGKAELVGTSAWFYFAVNLAKIPVYAALSWWSDGGSFFTWPSLGFAAACLPAVAVGVFGGRALFDHIPQTIFRWAVVVLSGIAALRLLIG